MLKSYMKSILFFNITTFFGQHDEPFEYLFSLVYYRYRDRMNNLDNDEKLFKYLVRRSFNKDLLLKYGINFFADEIMKDKVFQKGLMQEFRYKTGIQLLFDIIARNRVYFEINDNTIFLIIKSEEYHRFLYDRLRICFAKRLFRFLVLLQDIMDALFLFSGKEIMYRVDYLLMYTSSEKKSKGKYKNKQVDLSGDGKIIVNI